jgi:hypothetical protein
MNWKGVLPAVTTGFNNDLSVDHGFMEKHCRWLLDNGCTGIVALGSLGEGATLSFDEKLEILRTCVNAVRGRGPVVASISALTTSEAVAQAKAAADLGCDGLMVLPPYVYQGDWREMKTHVAAVFGATPLSCMLYNNPVAYGTDFLPEQIQQLAAEYRPSVHCSTVGLRYPWVWTTLYWKPWEWEQRDGSPAWRMRCPVNLWIFSTWASMEKVTRRLSCIAGSCPCCGWTLFQTSFNSSNWCRWKLGLGMPLCVPLVWNWWGLNVSKP